MLTLEEIKIRLQDRRPGMIADAVGVRVSTIIDIRDGNTENQSYSTIKVLSDYFEGKI